MGFLLPSIGNGNDDVNKHGVVAKLNDDGKKDGSCHTFLDDIVGAIAAAASIRVAQVISEEATLHHDVNKDKQEELEK